MAAAAVSYKKTAGKYQAVNLFLISLFEIGKKRNNEIFISCISVSENAVLISLCLLTGNFLPNNSVKSRRGKLTFGPILSLLFLLHQQACVCVVWEIEGSFSLFFPPPVQHKKRERNKPFSLQFSHCFSSFLFLPPRPKEEEPTFQSLSPPSLRVRRESPKVGEAR